MELYDAGDTACGLCDRESQNPDICKTRLYSFAKNYLLLTSIKRGEKRQRNKDQGRAIRKLEGKTGRDMY
jgi:hypothetical protein